MKSLRYYIRLTRAFILKFKGLLVIGIVIGIFIYAAAYFVMPFINTGSQIRIGISGRYHVEELPDEVVDKISDGLTKINESGLPEPAIASSWETPDQGNTWIFNMGESYWHDGNKVVSDDINYNFSDVEVDRPDDSTLVFKLNDIYSPFPVVASRPIFKKGLLGTGSWRVENLTISQGFVQALLLINNSEDSIKYKFYPNESQAKIGFKLGEVDQLNNIFNVSPFDEWDTVSVKERVRNDQIVTIFFNTQSDKFKGNKPLRQSLSYGINKDNLSKYRAISPINPNSWAYNPQVKSYDFDQDRAQELIEDFPEEEKKKEIQLTTVPALLETAEKIEKDWEGLGLNTSVHISSNPEGDYDAFLTIFDIPNDPDQYQIWHSTQDTNNLSNYGEDRIDGLLEQGRTELDLEERKKIYIDFQRFLLEDAPAVFLYHPVYFDVIRK